jgi:glucosamine--fructose-6-phosphate aminotransferase (isomerizing)
MCGIFGIISFSSLPADAFRTLAHHAEQRGRDSSGMMFWTGDEYKVVRADYPITRLLRECAPSQGNVSHLLMGHSRLITSGLKDNQPVFYNGIAALHNGIIVNEAEIWRKLGKPRKLDVDSEAIPAIAEYLLDKGFAVEGLPAQILDMCQGVVACALALPKLGKLCLFSNNGSLYIGMKSEAVYFSSESYPLEQLECDQVQQVKNAIVFDIPVCEQLPAVKDQPAPVRNLVPALGSSLADERLLLNPRPNLRRCNRCVLPETMPFIRFDEKGVCSYCNNYQIRNKPKPKEELFDLVASYRRNIGQDCIVPFSGGRDSCYGLHVIIDELKMRPVTYTYDWGMVTDLGRRNISRMCANLGVENIIVAADITQKRSNIAKNLRAWLKSPHLGMISLLTAGDKHFFQHIETVKRQTRIDLSLWGVNPLEVTHFKSGFLGIPPDFEEEKVYSNGALKQLRYQSLRLGQMCKSPGYFNSSLWDSLSGEYYRSMMKKSHYFHIFDYWTWDEKIVDQCLEQYGWEKAEDTSTTWRIGDGTAAFYNYIYYLVAGFTEHDTFRSNQIREGQMTRDEALVLIKEENRPRYPNIKWYLDAIDCDFTEVITRVNSIPRLYYE